VAALICHPASVPGDTVARLGGDEFVILLKDLGEAPLLAACHAELVAVFLAGAVIIPRYE
jgi:GGDEF domain-containing protein